MKVLVIAPHPDDEILGVGGTIAKRVAAGNDVAVCIVTRGQEPFFDSNLVAAGRREAGMAHEFLGVSNTVFLDLPAAMLDRVSQWEIINSLGKAINALQPEEVYIPYRGDIHVDHRVVADCAMVCLRPKYAHKVRRIYAYEVPSETGWDNPMVSVPFVPTVYEDISDSLSLKLQALSIYKSQSEKWPGARSNKAVQSLAEYRGSTICAEAAEAFALVREIK